MFNIKYLKFSDENVWRQSSALQIDRRRRQFEQVPAGQHLKRFIISKKIYYFNIFAKNFQVQNPKQSSLSIIGWV